MHRFLLVTATAAYGEHDPALYVSHTDVSDKHQGNICVRAVFL